MGPADAISEVVACGATGTRLSAIEHSCGRRSSLRALHARHDATTLSHAWGPPRERGTTWSMFSAAPPQYWHRWPSRAKTARRDSGAAARYGTRMHEPDHRRNRNRAPLGPELGAVAVEDLGLLLEHEHDRAAGRHDT
jgi:hypothetical protein